MPGLYFPPFHLDLERAELRHGERRVALRPKALALLAYLAARPGRLLSSDELRRAVWPDVAVSAVGLKVCIRELRVALGDTARAPRFIEAVPRRGYRFVAPVADDDASAGGSLPGLFGRAAELARLTQLWERARAGTAQQVWITGEAGIGKTAFVDAFLDQLPRGDAPPWAATGHCAEHYGSAEPFLPVLDALGRLAERAAPGELAAVLRRHAPTWLVQLPALLDDDERAALRRRQAGGTRERMLREITGALEALGASRPLVLVLEDVHWSDVSTLELLAALARRPLTGRVLIVATARPVALAAGDYPLGALIAELDLRRQAVALPLEPLGVGAVGDYLLDRFAGSAALAGLAVPIHRHTDGNPLFMVAVTDHLVARELIGRGAGGWLPRADADAIAAAIPDTLRALVGAQLAQLDPGERRLLEAASACGVEAAADVVAAALDQPVADAEAGFAALAGRRRFLRPAAGVERPDGSACAGVAFTHVLYQQTLYDGLGASRRTYLHQRIGARLESAYGGAAALVAPELAAHFERAGDRPRAIQHLQAAGERALDRHAYREAAAAFERALALLAEEPAGEARTARELALRVALGVPLLNARGFAAAEVRDTYDGALALCRQLGDAPQLFPVLEGLHTFYAVRGDIDTAHDLACQLQRLADETGAPAHRREAHHTLGCMQLKRGHLIDARAHLEQAVALDAAAPAADAFRLSGHDPRACCLSHLGHTLWLLGHPDQALQRARAAVAWAETLENAFSRALTQSSLSLVHLLRREPAATRAAAEAVLALAEAEGFPHFAALASMLRGWAVAVQGDADAGLEQLRTGLAVCAAIGVGRTEYLVLLADACVRTGRADEAVTPLDEAEAAVAAGGERYLDAEILRLRAALCRNPSDAAELLRAARRRAVGQTAGGLELRIATQLAALQHAGGQPAAAHATLAPLVAELVEGRETGDVAEARALLRAGAAGARTSGRPRRV